MTEIGLSAPLESLTDDELQRLADHIKKPIETKRRANDHDRRTYK